MIKPGKQSEREGGSGYHLMNGGDKTVIQTSGSLAAGVGLLPRDLYVSLEVLEGPDQGMMFNLTKTRTVLGRGEVDIRLTDPTVSGTHALIEYIGQELYLTDQRSSNGTFVNGARVDRSVVSNLDEIKLGNTKLLLCVVRDVYGTYMPEAEPVTREVFPAVDHEAITLVKNPIPNPKLPAEVRVLLLFLEGPDAGKRYLLVRQSTLLGRGKNVDIQLQDTTVSRRHCQIMISKNGQMGIKDLASANGTLVNGKPINAVKLSHNDLVQVGETKFRVIVL